MRNISLTTPIAVLTAKLPPFEQAKQELIDNHTVNESLMEGIKQEQRELEAQWPGESYNVTEQEYLERYYERALQIKEQYNLAYQEIVVNQLLYLGLSKKAALARSLHFTNTWHTYSCIGELLTAIHNDACFITKEEPREFTRYRRKLTTGTPFGLKLAREWKAQVAELEAFIRAAKPAVLADVKDLENKQKAELVAMREQHRLEKEMISVRYAELIHEARWKNPKVAEAKERLFELQGNPPIIAKE